MIPPLAIAVLALATVPAEAQTVSTLNLSQAIRTDGAMTDGTLLYVTEGWDGTRVHAVDLDTGQVSVALSGLLGPIDVAKDDQGLLYATEWRSNTISRGAFGTAASAWTSIGVNPDGLLFHSSGPLWCTLGTRNKIKTVDSTGVVTVLVNNSPETNYPLGIAEGPDGNMYVGGLMNGVVWRVSPAGDVDSLATVPSTGQYRIGHLEIAQGILFASGLSEHTLYTVTLDGDVNLFAGTPGVPGTEDGPAAQATLTAPIGLAATPSGDKLYVTSGFSQRDQVRVIDLSGVTGASAVGADASGRLRTVGPNPFRHEARVEFELARPAAVELEVIDVDGRRVRTLASGPRAAGRHVESWDGRTAAGRRASAGVYFVRLRAGDRVESERIVLSR